MELRFEGEIFEWRGPAPYYFVAASDEACGQIEALAREVSYGWGVIPVTAQIGATRWTTSLFPKDGGYLVPLKDKVRRAERLDFGDVVSVGLSVGR